MWLFGNRFASAQVFSNLLTKKMKGGYGLKDLNTSSTVLHSKGPAFIFRREGLHWAHSCYLFKFHCICQLRILGIDHPNKDLYYVIQPRREKEKLNRRFTSNKVS